MLYYLSVDDPEDVDGCLPGVLRMQFFMAVQINKVILDSAPHDRRRRVLVVLLSEAHCEIRFEGLHTIARRGAVPRKGGRQVFVRIARVVAIEKAVPKIRHDFQVGKRRRIITPVSLDEAIAAALGNGAPSSRPLGSFHDTKASTAFLWRSME